MDLARTTSSTPRNEPSARRPLLVLDAPARERLIELARAAYPAEGCGLLVGASLLSGAIVRVVDVTSARNRNVERARDRYELDPADQLAAEDAAAARGLDVVGVWHTHPDQGALPSETDRAGAWEGWSYLIVAVARGGVADLRSWRLAAGRFQEEEIR